MNEDFINEVLILTDEDGNEIECEVLDTIEYEGSKYVVLLSDDNDEELVILEEIPALDNPDDIDYEGLESEELLETIFNMFRERNKDKFDFED